MRDPSQHPERRFWTERGEKAFDFDQLYMSNEGIKAYKLTDEGFIEVKEESHGE